MSDTPLSAADALRAEERAIVQKREAHERPLFDRSDQLLAQIRPLVDELAALAPQFLTEYCGVMLALPASATAQALDAVARCRPRAAVYSAEAGGAITDMSASNAPPAAG